VPAPHRQVCAAYRACMMLQQQPLRHIGRRRGRHRRKCVRVGGRRAFRRVAVRDNEQPSARVITDDSREFVAKRHATQQRSALVEPDDPILLKWIVWGWAGSMFNVRYYPVTIMAAWSTRHTLNWSHRQASAVAVAA